MLNTADILNEAALILRGEHSAYRSGSDRYANAEDFLWRVKNSFNEDAKVVANDIRANPQAASEVCGLSPDRCNWIANRIAA